MPKWTYAAASRGTVLSAHADEERDHVVLGDRLDLGDGRSRGRRRRGAHRLDASAGTVPAAACASSTRVSTRHHSSYLCASLQTRPISGRV